MGLQLSMELYSAHYGTSSKTEFYRMAHLFLGHEVIADVLILNATNDWNLDLLPTHLGNQQSCLQEFSCRHMLYETGPCNYNKHMLITQVLQAYCMPESFCK